jgi:hypothetical protein
VLEATSGVRALLDRAAQAPLGIDYARSGELIAVAQPFGIAKSPWEAGFPAGAAGLLQDLLS